MTIRNLEPTISSISQLQGTCNYLEGRIFEKLIKLEAVRDVDGRDVTEATFDGGTIEELGKRKLVEGGPHSAFIDSERKLISIT